MVEKLQDRLTSKNGTKNTDFEDQYKKLIKTINDRNYLFLPYSSFVKFKPLYLGAKGILRCYYSDPENAQEFLKKHSSNPNIHQDKIDLLFRSTEKVTTPTVISLGASGRDEICAKQLNPDINLIGIDFSEVMLNSLKHTFEEYQLNPPKTLLADIEKQALEISDKADIFFSFAVMHHIDPRNIKKALKRVFDIMKPKAVGLISMRVIDQNMPISGNVGVLLKLNEERPIFYYCWKPNIFSKLLESCGFQISELLIEKEKKRDTGNPEATYGYFYFKKP